MIGLLMKIFLQLFNLILENTISHGDDDNYNKALFMMRIFTTFPYL